MAIFNWGIYAGIGLAFPVGRYVTEMNVGGLVSIKAYYRFGMLGNNAGNSDNCDFIIF